MTAKGRLALAGKLFLSLALLLWLVWAMDIQAVWQRLRQAELPWLLAAVLCLLAGQFLSAVRWTWLARGLGLDVRLGRKLELYFLGMFVSLFLPSIIGGDVARGLLLARGRPGHGWAAAASVLLERVNGVLGLSLVVTLSMLFLPIPASWWAAWLASLVLLWLGMFTHDRWFKRLPPMLASWRALPLTAPTFRSAWRRSLLLSFAFQALVVQAHVFLGDAVGLQLSWAAYGFIVCIVALASALPVSFNGFGVREAGYIGLAGYFGGQVGAAAAMAALWVVVLFIVALPGAFVLWRLGGKKAWSTPGNPDRP